MNVYTLDVKLFVSINVKAASEAEAREILDARLNFASIDWSDTNIDKRLEAGGLEPDGEHDLTEINGEMT